MEDKMKKHFLKGAAAVALLLIVALAGCTTPTTGGDTDADATLRYETVPYVPDAAPRAASADQDKLMIYSAYDQDKCEPCAPRVPAGDRV